MDEVEKLIEIYRQLEKAGLMVTAGKKSAAELMVSHDVVPVVRCKDCKWVYRDKYSGCYYCHERQVRSEHFCSYGERKDNE